MSKWSTNPENFARSRNSQCKCNRDFTEYRIRFPQLCCSTLPTKVYRCMDSPHLLFLIRERRQKLQDR